MKTCIVHKVAAVLALLFTFHGATASASAIYEFNEVGGNVVGNLTGSLDLTGLTGTPGFVAVSGGGIAPSAGVFSSNTVSTPQTRYDVVGPSSFGSGGGIFANTVSGLSVYAITGNLWLDTSYVSGAAMLGSMSFLSATMSSLGVTTGSHVYTLRNQETFTVTFNESQVPAPATLALFGLGLAGLGWSRREKT